MPGHLRSRLVLGAALAGAVAACTVGAPPGFSGGDRWAFPLVGPLEDGALLVPVTINGHGPFLFLIDPDAPMTSIDERIAAALDLYGGLGPRIVDESDTTRPTRFAEVSAIRVGNLTVSHYTVMLDKPGVFDVAGREVAGVLGRDIIAESLVFGFDRDAGMAYLATRESFTAPDGSIRLGYRDVAMRNGASVVPGPTRRLVTAKVNGAEQVLHVDLGAYQSQLRDGLWKDAKLTPLPYRAQLVDEAGTARAVDRAGIANQVAVGDVVAKGLLMVPYADKRTDPEQIDGALGLNFFAPYAVWADWSGRAIYVRPRDEAGTPVDLRLARWDSPVLAACHEPACVTASVAPSPPPAGPAAGAPAEDEPAPPVELEVVRAPDAKDLVYEVTLEAVDPEGNPQGLPLLVATFPRGVLSIREQLSGVYAPGSLFRVVDVSPFVRVCQQPGGCIFELASR
ncbi:MAG TPA: pepsin/retropepsin-like aspartic protease family protein [Kofleriaceae bacterium]|nr:pepsin/retropepsin-like aspartic protease family protein [Kofleriaceae bacterium]